MDMVHECRCLVYFDWLAKHIVEGYLAKPPKTKTLETTPPPPKKNKIWGADKTPKITPKPYPNPMGCLVLWGLVHSICGVGGGGGVCLYTMVEIRKQQKIIKISVQLDMFQ